MWPFKKRKPALTFRRAMMDAIREAAAESALFKGTSLANGLRCIRTFERVVMHKGRLAPEGSTATAYCWLVWVKGETGTKFDWIAPCRKRLEREGDYL